MFPLLQKDAIKAEIKHMEEESTHHEGGRGRPNDLNYVMHLKEKQLVTPPSSKSKEAKVGEKTYTIKAG